MQEHRSVQNIVAAIFYRFRDTNKRQDKIEKVTPPRIEVLVLRRAERLCLGGYWEFPGGKLEDGETLEEGLKREIQEELGLDIHVEEAVGENYFNYVDKKHKNTKNAKIVGFLCSVRSSIELDHLAEKISPSLHQDLKWVTQNEIDQIQMAPADIPLIPFIFSLAERKLIGENHRE